MIITYFLITLLVVFIGINVTHSYLERRHLILAMESSLQRSTQVIDDFAYYTGYIERNTARFQQRGVTTFVPIDCTSARRIFDEEFTTQWALTKALNLSDDQVTNDRELRSGVAGTRLWNGSSSSMVQPPSTTAPPSTRRLISVPTVTSFACDGRTVAASAELLIELPFQISFAGVEFMRFTRQRVDVRVGLVLGG